MSQRKPSYLLSTLIFIKQLRQKYQFDIMKVRVQLVQNNPAHRVPSIFLNIHKTQFIFNIIPTLLRHRKLHQINLHNSSHIFFTKNSIQAMGGLPNYLLFRSGAEHSNSRAANKVCMYGDNQMMSYIEKLRFKLGYKSLRFAYTSWDKSIYRYGISSLKLYNRLKNDPQLPKIFVKMQDYLSKKAHTSDYFDIRPSISNIQTKDITTDCPYYHSKLVNIYPVVTRDNNNTTTHYLCIFPECKKGIHVNLQQFLQESKITKQKQIKQFLSEGSITKNGRTYKKQEYLFKENQKPTSIAIFHYVNLKTVENLLANPLIINYFENSNHSGLVIHIVQDDSIINSLLFKQFIAKFDKTTKHLWYYNQKNSHGVIGEQVLEENLRQISIWSKIFPLLIKNITLSRINYLSTNNFNPIFNEFSNLNNIFYERIYAYIKNDYLGDKYAKRIQRQEKYSRIDLLKNIISQKNQQLIQIKQKILNYQRQNVNLQAKVVFLGTASSVPLATRNTSGVLVCFQENHHILLDCGEETFEQFVNHYSPQQYEKELLKLRVIFITHIHSDHNLGILNLISERNKIMKKHNCSDRVFLIIPFNVYNWYLSFNELIQNLSFGCDVLFTQVLLNEQYQEPFVNANNQGQDKSFSCSQKNVQDHFFAELEISTKTREIVLKELPNQQLIVTHFRAFLNAHHYRQFLPIRVIHCPQSFGIILSNDKYKVSYSGDTRPSAEFKAAARNSNLIIHEATFNDEENHKAVAYRHSTVSQAVQIGQQSNSQKLAITHFNQHFKPPKKLNSSEKYSEYFQNHTIFSLDHLEINMDKMDILPIVTRFISQTSYEANTQYSLSKQMDKKKVVE